MPEFDWPELQKGLKFYEREKLRYIPLIWGSKRPSISWKPYQNKQPDFEELADWFHEGKPANVGIICGEASGGLVALSSTNSTQTSYFPLMLQLPKKEVAYAR